MIKIDKAKCNGCKNCIEICPVEAISLNYGVAFIDSTRCINCRMCLVSCKEKAITGR